MTSAASCRGRGRWPSNRQAAPRSALAWAIMLVLVNRRSPSTSSATPFLASRQPYGKADHRTIVSAFRPPKHSPYPWAGSSFLRGYDYRPWSRRIREAPAARATMAPTAMRPAPSPLRSRIPRDASKLGGGGSGADAGMTDGSSSRGGKVGG